MNVEDDLLSAIEAVELRSLQWGYVDGLLRVADIDVLAERSCAENDDPRNPIEIVESLVAQRLLFEFRGGDGLGYRSRFAETVRLLSQLRQLMPGKPWATAPRLVSDYRVDSSSRLFPRRWLDASAHLEEMTRAGAITPEQRALAEAILTQDGQTVSMSDFQMRALEWANGSGPEFAGCVVTAGTGSGKTLAFYLPAIMQAGSLASPDNWTKCVSVYPRRELLKDQFTEVFRLLRRVAPVMEAAGKRRLSAGALYSGSPHSATEEAVRAAGWPPGARGFVCPYLRCPSCGSDLVWPVASLQKGAERLECTGGAGCSVSVGPDEVPLTRRSTTGAPPDFVFTTTETLNQRLSDPGYWAALGVSPRRDRGARWALLDEVHTYSGSDGAHVGYAIRRWRHAVGRSVRLVGLSATLVDAATFFAELTGLPADSVREVGPLPTELQPLGAQYQLILRGDPASRTSLLSTSIQASFLLPRMLDPLGPNRPSNGRLGSRAFVFTDDLDVTNRLFDDIRDAEAYDIFGNPDPGRRPLASLRSSAEPEPSERGAIGQRWDKSERIGHVLSRRLGVSRTTSRDTGVASTTELVVATSSLEVGFNDTTVGGVVQHKAPRSLAAFLQRKGRAGRTTHMRPWMITVLSDYGRDRTAFRNYERLFDPSLPPQKLPLRNRHVLSIQAAYSLIDWLAKSAPKDCKSGWWWWPLNGPTDDERRRRQQGWIADTVHELRSIQGERMADLRNHLAGALGLEAADLEAILWRQPRPLLTTLLPTISRRLETGWRKAPAEGSRTYDLFSAGPTPHPLPDFLPASLFSDLNLPEVIVEIPPPTKNDDWSTDMLPIAQALDVLAPGRVTRRFAHARGKLSHWVPIPTDVAEYRMPISEFASETEPIGPATSALEPGASVNCFRPWKVRLEQAPKNVRETSNSSFAWQSTITPGASPIELPPPSRGAWSGVLASVQFFLHSQHDSVRVRRIAEAADARIRLRGEADERRVAVTFISEDGSRAALGFEHEVDGLRVQIPLPNDEAALSLAHDPTLCGPLARHRFTDMVLGDGKLAGLANRFQLDWLQQIYFAAVMHHAVIHDLKIGQAATVLTRTGLLDPCRRVMADMLRFIAVDGDEDEPGPDGSPSADRTTDRLAAALEDLVQEPGVAERLATAVRSVFDPQAAEYAAWIRGRVASALGDAVLTACAAMAPGRAADEELLLDVITRPTSDGSYQCEVWVTERAAGGTGTLQAVASGYASDPMAFSRAMDAAVAPSDFEVTAQGLGRALELFVSDRDIADAAQAARGTNRHAERAAAQSSLFALLSRHGIAVDRTLGSGLNLRLLRQGVPPGFDQLLADLRAHWASIEARTGVAVDLRTFVFLATVEPALGARLTQLVASITGHTPTAGEAVGVLAGVLWAPEWEVRAGRDHRGRYSDPGLVEPALLRVMTRRTGPRVQFGSRDWQELSLVALAESGEVTLMASAPDRERVHGALVELLATPIDAGFLQFYPSIDAVEQSEEGLSIQLVIREFA
jgi:hypothetical protein